MLYDKGIQRLDTSLLKCKKELIPESKEGMNRDIQCIRNVHQRLKGDGGGHVWCFNIAHMCAADTNGFRKLQLAEPG